MKKIIAILSAVLITAGVFAQAPQKISYQAVVRNAEGKLVTNQSVGTRISILQGSVTGTEVFKEIYNPNPSTNANGLVSIEIGNGIALTGTFANIDWSGGTYFIKTETDPTGGTNYTISGTSQLLSVPYALYAQKAGNSFSGNYTDLSGKPTLANIAISGSYADLTGKPNLADTAKYLKTEKEPAFNASVAKSIKASDTTKWYASIHKIGDSYGGGIVFYVYDGGQHGLIAATADQSASIRWYAGTFTHTVAYADGVGAGKANTAIIIANQGYGDGATYAARICNEYSVTVGGVTYGDWYLPSKYELNLLYQQKSIVGGFASAYYWSSTEGNNYHAWNQYFNGGNQYDDGKDVADCVRAIRAF